jgi:hypothetical protein
VSTVGTVGTSKRMPPPAAPPGPQPELHARGRHQVRPVEEMAADEDL